MSRTTARETAMKLLFEAEFNTDPQDTLTMLEPLDLTDQDRAFMARIKSGVLDNLDQIDAALEKYVVGWQPERLAKVDRSILRLAVYELLFTDVPASVVVNEAVNMAGVFSSDESTAFVNGILGNFVRDHSADRQL
jgi:N utilization substance protein B